MKSRVITHKRLHQARPGKKRVSGEQVVSGVLAHQETFPYDVLDEVFCFACENQLQRALDLGSVCRFWYERFRKNDRMWEQLCRAVVRIPRPRKRPSGGGPLIPTEWNTYLGVRRAVEVSKQFSPIPPENLRTMNGCGAVDIEDNFPEVFSPASSRSRPITSVRMKFRCPLVLEALTLVTPGVAACHLCNRKVYKVRNQEELEERARKGGCVWIEPRDLDPTADIETDVEVALFTEDFDQAVTALSTIAVDPRVTERSTSMFPVFAVKAVDGRDTCRLRFTTFCFPSNLASEAVDATLGRTRSSMELVPSTYERRFRYLWFQPPPSTEPAERSSWVPKLPQPRDAHSSQAARVAVAREALASSRSRKSSDTPNEFLTSVFRYLSRRAQLNEIMGEVEEVRPRPPPTCCQKVARSCRKCCSIQ